MKAGATVERKPVEAIAEETVVKTAKKDQLLVQYALDDFITNGVASSEQKDATFSSPTSPPVQSPTPSTLEEELALESLMKNWRMAEVRLLQANRLKKEEEAVLDTKKRLRAYRRARELRLAKDWLQETPTPAAFIRGRGGFDQERGQEHLHLLSPGEASTATRAEGRSRRAPGGANSLSERYDPSQHDYRRSRALKPSAAPIANSTRLGKRP